jgi:tRNA threonylcarbamoyladenosine biosynthesis protein TsaE
MTRIATPKKKKEYISNSPAETTRIAREIAKELKPGDIIYLIGELGSGKTVFVKGVCAGLGVKEEVTSPSFVIATEYHGFMMIAHVDLYRLPGGEVSDLPVEDYTLENGITLIEWADRITVRRNGISIKFDIIDHKRRKIEIEDLRD